MHLDWNAVCTPYICMNTFLVSVIFLNLIKILNQRSSPRLSAGSRYLSQNMRRDDDARDSKWRLDAAQPDVASSLLLTDTGFHPVLAPDETEQSAETRPVTKVKKKKSIKWV